MKDEIKLLKQNNEELKNLLKYTNEVILQKIIEKSNFYEEVRNDVEAYQKSKKTIDEHLKLVDRINSIREDFLDIAEKKYPKIYNEFVKDVYEDPYDVLVFIKAFIKEITGVR